MVETAAFIQQRTRQHIFNNLGVLAVDPGGTQSDIRYCWIFLKSIT